MIQSGALLTLKQDSAVHLSDPVIVAATAGSMTAVQEEASAIHTHLPKSRVFIDEPAIPYLQRLDHPPEYLHIAAHTLQRDDAPLFTGVRLSQEVLTVEQCYELPLRGTQLVTLSGCATGSGLDTGGALLALQTACFVAGAQRVLSSLWPVSDAATAHWMDDFYDYIADGSDPCTAIRQAQLAQLNQPGYCPPAVWAAFACWRR